MIHPRIRPYEPKDHAQVVGLAQAFIIESIYGRLFPTIGLSGVLIEGMIQMCLDFGTIIIAEVDDRLAGMVGLVLVPDHPMTGQPVVEEIAWFVSPAHRHGRVGPLLLGAAEAWTTTKSASVIKVVAPAGSDVGKFLERRGYTAVETAYMRRPPFAVRGLER